jgi:hypothetical protein
MKIEKKRILVTLGTLGYRPTFIKSTEVGNLFFSLVAYFFHCWPANILILVIAR